MDHGALESKNRLIHRVVEIISELRASLNFEAGGEIAANMGDLYDYAGRQLIRANHENRTDLVDEVSHLLREIRSAWIQIPTRRS